MDTGLRIKLVREHRGLTQQKLGEMLGYGKSSANRIAQYEMGYRSPKANRLKEIAKAMNIREEIFLMPDETPIDLLRILIWYDWEHEGVLQLATSRTIALKEQTKNRMNFETGYLFCHVETKSSNVCSGIFCFSDLFGMTSIVPRTVGADSISARGALPLLQTSRVAGEH